MNNLIGDRLSEFYVALRQSETKRLVRCLYYLEIACIEQLIYSVNNPEQVSKANVISVLYDIVDDCRKKCANNLRSLYVEFMNSLISSTKKQLLAKIKKNQTHTSISKYIYALTELLGSFSNVISELQSNYIETLQNGSCINYMSASLLLLTVLPMHTRVISIVFNYFKDFIDDKQLLKLQCKTIEELNSVMQLDASIITFIEMKDITYQYVMFFLNAIMMQQQQYQDNIDHIVNCVLQSDATGKFSIQNESQAQSQAQLPLPPGVRPIEPTAPTDPSTGVREKYNGLLAFLHVQFLVDSKTITGAKGITIRHYQGQSTDISVADGVNTAFVLGDADLHLFQFREFDPLYTTLENLYLSKSVLQALYGEGDGLDIELELDRQTIMQQMQLVHPFTNNLLLIEGEEPMDPLLGVERSNKPNSVDTSDNVYVVECIEDVCFIFTKVMERVLMCNENTSILAMSNKIIEYIDPMQDSKLYQALLDKTIFKHCYKSFRQKQKEHVLSVLKQREMDLVSKFHSSSPNSANGVGGIYEDAPSSGNSERERGMGMGMSIEPLPSSGGGNGNGNGIDPSGNAIDSGYVEVSESGTKNLSASASISPPSSNTNTTPGSGSVDMEELQVPSMAGVDVAVNATAHMINNLSELSSSSMGDISSWWGSASGSGDVTEDGGTALLNSITNFSSDVMSNAVQTTTQLTGVDVKDIKMDGSLLLQGTNTLSNALFQQDLLPRNFGTDVAGAGAGAGAGTVVVPAKNRSIDHPVVSGGIVQDKTTGGLVTGDSRGDVSTKPLSGPVTLHSLNDISVYISSLCVFYSSIMTLGDMMYGYYDRQSQYYSSITEASNNMSHTVSTVSAVNVKNGWDSQSSMYMMVLQELERCRFYYKELITVELYKYMSPYLEKEIKPIIYGMMDTYAIDGNEYDVRRNSEDCPLLIELKVSLGVAIQSSSGIQKTKSTSVGVGVKNGYIIKELKPGLSNIAYKHLLYGIGSCIAETIISILYTKCVRFTEWGALLLEEEIHSIIHLLEDATIDVADFEHDAVGSAAEGQGSQTINNNKKENIALLFHRLVWCMKLMTLDQVIDVKKYKLPMAQVSAPAPASAPSGDGNKPPLLTDSDSSGFNKHQHQHRNNENLSTNGSNSAVNSIANSNSQSNLRETVYIVENDVYKDSWQLQVPRHSNSNAECKEKQSSGKMRISSEKGSRVLFNDHMIRCLLSRRIEFSRDAVAKIKFN